MALREDVSFSCLALDEAYLYPGGTVAVSEETEVSAATPVALDEGWKTFLGSIQADKFERSGLFITTQRAIPRFGREAHTESQQTAHLFHYCLLLQGCAFSPSGQIVSGYNENGRVRLEQLGPIDGHPRPSYRRFTRVTADRIVEAGQLFQGVAPIYAGGDYPFRPYRRLRLGFNSWIFGLRSMHVDHRLHWFVRSLEAIMKLPRYGITPTFKKRGQEFTGFSTRNEKMFKQLYDLRSCVAHVKEYRQELRKPKGIARDHAFAFWSLCAELLASEVYKRIFQSVAFRDSFLNEARAAGFWRRKPLNRSAVMGTPIDALSLTRQSLRLSPEEPWL